jgi:hypothetical protein
MSIRILTHILLAPLIFTAGVATGFLLSDSLRPHPIILDSGTESEFISLINSERAANGLKPLTKDGALTSYARVHTADMIGSGSIYHSTSAQLAAAGGTGWEKMGENVGRGQSPTMASPGHAANILGNYNYIGVGTDTSPDGLLYVTVIFMSKPLATTTTAPPTTVAPSTTVVVAPPTTIKPVVPPTTRCS